MRIFFSLILFISLFANGFAFARTNQYYEQVLIHSVSKECRKSNECISEIIEGEINYATKLYLIEVLKIFENVSSDILKNIRKEIEKETR